MFEKINQQSLEVVQIHKSPILLEKSDNLSRNPVSVALVTERIDFAKASSKTMKTKKRPRKKPKLQSIVPEEIKPKLVDNDHWTNDGDDDDDDELIKKNSQLSIEADEYDYIHVVTNPSTNEVFCLNLAPDHHPCPTNESELEPVVVVDFSDEFKSEQTTSKLINLNEFPRLIKDELGNPITVTMTSELLEGGRHPEANLLFKSALGQQYEMESNLMTISKRTKVRKAD